MYLGQFYKLFVIVFFFFKQKTAYEMRISDWSSDVCSSDLIPLWRQEGRVPVEGFDQREGNRHADGESEGRLAWPFAGANGRRGGLTGHRSAARRAASLHSRSHS